MSSSYNRIVLVGTVGRDAELRATPKGTQTLSTSIAVDDRRKKDDRGKAGTEWYRITIWGRQAETLAQYLTKGKTILVDGRLSIQTWQDRNGKDRYTPEGDVDQVTLLGGPREDRGGREEPRAAAAYDDSPAAAPLDDSDIPFSVVLPLLAV